MAFKYSVLRHFQRCKANGLLEAAFVTALTFRVPP